MSNYPDDFRGTNMDDREEAVDNRNEDDIIEDRLMGAEVRQPTPTNCLKGFRVSQVAKEVDNDL